jgi:hypothetical protein
VRGDCGSDAAVAAVLSEDRLRAQPVPLRILARVLQPFGRV